MRLTTEQSRIVDDPRTHKYILAGAGSGKTELLVAQVERWLDDGADPGTMAAITFTRRAGRSLAQRLEERDITIGFVGTQHALQHSLLRYGADPAQVIVDHTDLMAIEEHMKADLRLRQLPDALIPEFCVQHALLPIGDIPQVALDRMRRDDGFRDWSRSQVRTVLWDEYQDADADGIRWLHYLDPDRICAVGDPHQAIYGWRGADASVLRDCARLTPELSLSINFRSGRAIIEAANAVNGQAAPLTPWRIKDGEVHLRPHTTRTIWDMVADVPRPCTVLARSNRELIYLRDMLRGQGYGVMSVLSQEDPLQDRCYRLMYVACRAVLSPDNPWLQSQVPSIMGVDADFPGGAISVARLVAPEVEADVGPSASVRDWVEWYQSRDLQDLLPRRAGDYDYLLCTVHTAKGLEWPRVCLVNVGRQLRATDDESRNILYVGMTRARDELHLIGDEYWLSLLQAQIEGGAPC